MLGFGDRNKMAAATYLWRQTKDMRIPYGDRLHETDGEAEYCGCEAMEYHSNSTLFHICSLLGVEPEEVIRKVKVLQTILVLR